MVDKHNWSDEEVNEIMLKKDLQMSENLEERNRGRLFKDWGEANEALNLLIISKEGGE